jgi:hypothetical protein
MSKRFLKLLSVLVALVAVSAVGLSNAAFADLGSSYKYYNDGYVDARGTFRPYDYNYYHKDGYRSQSYYGDVATFNEAYKYYRGARDQRLYGYYYSNSYDTAGNYVYNRDNYYNFYDYTVPAGETYLTRSSKVDRFGAPFYSSYTAGSCDLFDTKCQFHKTRDVVGDYNYVQYAPDRYVRSDYYSPAYDRERQKYLDYISSNY